MCVLRGGGRGSPAHAGRPSVELSSGAQIWIFRFHRLSPQSHKTDALPQIQMPTLAQVITSAFDQPGIS